MKQSIFVLAILLLSGLSLTACEAGERGNGKKPPSINGGEDEDTGEDAAFFEVETEDMIEFRLHAWSAAMSSSPGIIVELKHLDKNAVFECSLEKGYFFNTQQQTLKDQKFIIAEPGSIFYWSPHFDEYITEPAFIDIVLKIDGNIIGYSVIDINSFGDPKAHAYVARLLASALIPQIDGEYQNVTEEQIKAAIERVKERGETL